MAETERDNLTEALTGWQKAGVKKKDLSAVTLWRDFMDDYVNSASMMETSTQAVQMVQGGLFEKRIFVIYNKISKYLI